MKNNKIVQVFILDIYLHFNTFFFFFWIVYRKTLPMRISYRPMPIEDFQGSAKHSSVYCLVVTKRKINAKKTYWGVTLMNKAQTS